MFTALIRVNQFRGGNDKHSNQSLRRVYDRHWLIAGFSRSPLPSKNQSPFSRLPAVAYHFSLASPQSAISRFLSPHGHQLHSSRLPIANNHFFPVPIQNNFYSSPSNHLSSNSHLSLVHPQLEITFSCTTPQSVITFSCTTPQSVITFLLYNPTLSHPFLLYNPTINNPPFPVQPNN